METPPFSPRLDILPPAQRRSWPELAAVPKEFELYEGTALALQLGHRDSEDFDFFARAEFHPEKLQRSVDFLATAKVIRQELNTLEVMVERGGPVRVSFFGVPKLRRLRLPHVAPDNGLKVASLLDLAGTKAAVVQQRAEMKDYLDLDALIRIGKISLPTALAAAQSIYGETFNPQETLKSLSFFDDGNLHKLSEDVKLRLVKAARDVDMDHLPSLDLSDRDWSHDLGPEL